MTDDPEMEEWRLRELRQQERMPLDGALLEDPGVTSSGKQKGQRPRLQLVPTLGDKPRDGGPPTDL